MKSAQKVLRDIIYRALFLPLLTPVSPVRALRRRRLPVSHCSPYVIARNYPGCVKLPGLYDSQRETG